ncbi:hypothetical protein I6H88_19765 [Elizabethkingia bruuniana]|uniref:Uncharacterized protein n=1 Tax=Elizabethkingia bruuniana TaxID=1756149 RepID=A0A7T7ZXR0_9FLAO|nr:hypothetical protein [Elizabethkingia bruuniana]KGO11559.1 hypothetical protein KS04_04265 [Elizabethkingia miricola]AQX85142.1 hypothetical protein AYC65_09045 [Elizabethkingia bruuniana]KUY28671.1 hypothetical protein ATB97_00625 [Elizabethkingia bruuniana]OPB70301.1 hypothetical protein BAY12_16735 [Elizabethkingia bruuniana]QDZ62464.1 hypothetical protein EVD20_06150 [Elizabethkingia bruuniana]
MSGSGSSGYIPPKRTDFDCETSIINTNISSIDIEILKKHKIGDILTITISKNSSLVVENNNGEILGSILHINTSQIIECIMERNSKYIATIMNIDSHTCKIKIKNQES